MSRYATREEEVDRLLRGRVFVDLHRVVRQGLRASVERYSIKRLEPFYGFRRRVDLTAATRALVRFEAALESGEAHGTADALRTEIEGYNRDDCLSTLRLAEWLEGCRRELEIRTGQPVPRPALRDDAREHERESAAEVAALFESLTAELPEEDDGLDDEQRARRRLAHLLEFHRREEKSMWWEFFDRCGFSAEEHVASRATLGALRYVGEAGQVRKSIIHRYRFPEQTHEMEVGKRPQNPATVESNEQGKGSCGTVVAIDEAARTIDLRARPHFPGPPSGGARPARRRQQQGASREPAAAGGGGRVERLRGGQSAPRGVRSAARHAAAHRNCRASTQRPEPVPPRRPCRSRRPRCARRNAAGRRSPDRLAPRPLHPPGAGTARQREDLHWRADDPRPAGRGATGRRHRQQPQGDLQPARRGVGGGRRAPRGTHADRA